MTSIQRVAPGDADYPDGLALLETPPEIWVRGVLPSLAHSVAIVGSRHPTPYGQRVARRLASSCASLGIAVVSGLAIGIDGCAHLGALDARDALGPAAAPTIAVVAHGLDRVHPRAHHELAERIAVSGAIVSAYPAGTPVGKHRFLERNRLIAALATALVVVEGVHPASGALSTVQRAQALGRAVLAVPGAITTPQASAPNALLRDGCAPCLDATDVAVAIGLSTTPPAVAASRLGRQIIDALASGPLDVSSIADLLGADPSGVAREVIDLEVAGLLRRTTLGAYETALT